MINTCVIFSPRESCFLGLGLIINKENDECTLRKCNTVAILCSSELGSSWGLLPDRRMPKQPNHRSRTHYRWVCLPWLLPDKSKLRMVHIFDFDQPLPSLRGLPSSGWNQLPRLPERPKRLPAKWTNLLCPRTLYRSLWSSRSPTNLSWLPPALQRNTWLSSDNLLWDNLRMSSLQELFQHRQNLLRLRL